MVASGNMTEPNLDTYYYRIISLRSMRTVVLLDELYNIETRTVDISNAYLNAHTTEKILFNTRPEFSPFGHTSHLLIINTDLYGLNSSGDILNSHLSDYLTYLGFIHSMGGCDIWMRN